MSDQILNGITRWDIGPDHKLITAKMVERDNGQYVDVLDVIALLEQARAGEREKVDFDMQELARHGDGRYEQGQRDERERIRTGVAGMPPDRPGGVRLQRAAVLAVIDGEDSA